MRRAGAVAALAATAAAGLVLVLGGGNGCADPTERPECVAQAYAAGGGAEKCRLVAPELLEQLTGARGAAALRICERNVQRIGPSGDVRVVEREPVGGVVRVEVLVDGREGVMALERRGGRWLITSFAE